jgi:para-nitrobenzyl esterase
MLNLDGTQYKDALVRCVGRMARVAMDALATGMFVVAFAIALASAAAFVAPGAALAQGGQEDVQAPVKEFPKVAAGVVKTANGDVDGTLGEDGTVRIYRGIPFAAPPVGDLRWREPQPPANWTGVRDGSEFASRCTQARVYADMVFRDKGNSEDCLYLNVWTPKNPGKKKLGVMLWFFGGGFTAGSGDEFRYDGEALAKKGIIVVTCNYRLGVFGFFSHPELTKESPNHASGNYGLLDQTAAMDWVVKNIAAFGGDPKNITLGGESAGSFSVSAQMASPLAIGKFQKAIGESGAFFSNGSSPLRTLPLAKSEEAGAKFGSSIGANTLADLRAIPADKLLQEVGAQAAKKDGYHPSPNIDGYFLTESPADTFAAGKQAHVPLLAGWNRDEVKMAVLFNPKKPTPQSFADDAKAKYGDASAEFLKLYPASTDAEALQSAYALASDNFIIFSTWKWVNMQVETAKAPVYHYIFEEVPATKPGSTIGPSKIPASEVGARHAGEIEYVFGTLKWEALPWTPEDFKVSDLMVSYWANFIAKGDPNGPGLPKWPRYDAKDDWQTMHLVDDSSAAAPEANRGRYVFMDQQAPKLQAAQAGNK